MAKWWPNGAKWSQKVPKWSPKEPKRCPNGAQKGRPSGSQPLGSRVMRWFLHAHRMRKSWFCCSARSLAPWMGHIIRPLGLTLGHLSAPFSHLLGSIGLHLGTIWLHLAPFGLFWPLVLLACVGLSRCVESSLFWLRLTRLTGSPHVRSVGGASSLVALLATSSAFRP